MKIAFGIALALLIASFLLLRSVPSSPNLDRDMPRGCLGIVLGLAGAAVMAVVIVIALIGAL